MCDRMTVEQADNARIAEELRDLIPRWVDLDPEEYTGEDATGILTDVARILRPVWLPDTIGAVIYAIPMGSQYGRDDEVELTRTENGWEGDGCAFSEFELRVQFHNHRVPTWHVQFGDDYPVPVSPDTEEAARSVARIMRRRDPGGPLVVIRRTADHDWSVVA